MTDFRVVATSRDTAQATASLHEMGRALQAAGLPIVSIASHGVSFMSDAGYEIVLGDPGCTVIVTRRAPDRLVKAVTDALAAHMAKLIAERDARADIRMTLADACVIAGRTTGRRFPDEARGIAGLPVIAMSGGEAVYTGGKGALASQTGQPVMSWLRRAIRAHLDDDRVTYVNDVLTIKQPMDLPETMLASCTGHPVDRIADFAPFRRQQVLIARAWMHADSKGVRRLKIRVKSASLGLHDAAKAIDRVHDLARMGKVAA